MPLSTLRQRAESLKLSPGEIDAAIDKGASDGHQALVDLILIAEEKVGLDRLYDQSVSALYHMAIDAGAKREHINRCLDHKKQKESFIALLTKILDTNEDGHVSLAEITAVAESQSSRKLAAFANPMGEEQDDAEED